MVMTTMRDLPAKLVGEKILTKIPITSLREVRSTCKLWNDLSKAWLLSTRHHHQFLGFMTMDSKLCSLRVSEDCHNISIQKVDLFNQVEISRVFHCSGLLLCVLKDNSSLVLWNPYLGQTQALGIRPRTSFHRFDRYALGFDEDRNPKILRFVQAYDLRIAKYDFAYEIYDLNSDSWRGVDVTPDFEIEFHQHGAPLKGNAYFFAHEEIPENVCFTVKDFFLLCFDFTRERFRPRLPLPFQSYSDETVALSCVRDEQLAVLYQRGEEPSDTFEIWVTTRIEPHALSWMRFLKLDRRPVIRGDHLQLGYDNGSFFIDEDKKLAVVFDTWDEVNHTAYIIGRDGYFKRVRIGQALYFGKLINADGHHLPSYYPPFVCSSPYLPSLVQINQPRKRKHKRKRKDKLIANQPTKR